MKIFKKIILNNINIKEKKSNNSSIYSIVNGLEKKDITIINKVLNNNNCNIVLSTLYKENKLSSDKLKFLIENFSNDLYTYSSLIKIL